VKSLPTARPDGLLAAVMIAFLASAGLFYVNIMSALVSGLVEGLSFSVSDAGYVSSANVYGAAAGALLAVFVVKRLSWRPTAVALLLVLIAIDLLSTQLHTFELLLFTRFVHGFVGGMLVGVGFAVVARTGAADRVFGMLLVVQFGLGGLGIMTLPRLVPIYGHGVLFLSLAAFSAVALIMVPFLAEYPPRAPEAVTPENPSRRVEWRALALTLAAVFLFQSGNMGLAAYLIGLGTASGLDVGYASGALGLSTWVGIAGCALVVVIGTRFGRTRLLAAAMVLTLIGTAAFHASESRLVYLLANCATSITWSFVISYLLGMCAQFDASGQTAALGGFVSKMGLASGPFIGGLLLSSGKPDYAFLINACLVALAASMLVMLPPAARLDKRRDG